MTTSSFISDACDRLLQGERTAVQCYATVLRRFGSDPRIDPLKFIKAQHEASVQELELIASPFGTPSEFLKGTWGASPDSVDTAKSLFGERSVIDCLLSGERALKTSYEGIFSDSACRDPLLHSLFSIVLLPRSQRHVIALERLKELFGRRANFDYSLERSSVYPWAAAPPHWN